MSFSFSDLKESVLRTFRQSVLLGLDLGSRATKIVRYDRGKGLTGLDLFYYPGPIQLSDAPSLQKFRLFLKEHQLEGLPAACTLEDPSLKIRRVDLPKMPEFDLKEAVKWQLRNVVEDPLDLYLVRYSILDEYVTNEGARFSLQVYAVHKEAVQNRAALLRKVSLKPQFIEPTAVAHLSGLDRLLEWPPEGVVGILDIGEKRSGFLVAGEGKLFFSRPLPEISLGGFTQLLAQEIPLSEAEAFQVKEKVVRGETMEKSEKVFLLLPTFYSQMAVEIQRSMDAFSLLFQNRRVDSVYLCGGGAALPGLKDYLVKNLGMSLFVLDPFEGLNLKGGPAGHLYTAATGLILHEL